MQLVIDARDHSEAYAVPRGPLCKLYYQACASSFASRSPPGVRFTLVVDPQSQTPPSSPLTKSKNTACGDYDSCLDVFVSTLKKLLPAACVAIEVDVEEGEDQVWLQFGVIALTQIMHTRHHVSELSLIDKSIELEAVEGSQIVDIISSYENVVRNAAQRFKVHGLDAGYVVSVASAAKHHKKVTGRSIEAYMIYNCTHHDSKGVFLKIETESGSPALDGVASPRLYTILNNMYQGHMRYTSDVVMITGALGFIGSHVADAIVARMPHSRIVILDKHTYASNVRNIRNLAGLERVNVECVDLGDENAVRNVVRRHRPSLVLHLAAESHVDRSFGNSLQFTKSNVVGTHTLLEALREAGCLKYFVHMSTDEVYGAGHGLEDTNGHHPDTSLLMPTNPYAASKAAAEMQCNAYRTSFGMPIVIVRCNNVYGPRQFPEKAVPRFILQLSNGQKCTIHGQGRSLRSFLYVTDAARAVVAAVSLNVDHQSQRVINVHSEEEISVLELARRVRSALGTRTSLRDAADEDFVEFVSDRAFNDLRYLVEDNVLGASGWVPLIPFEIGLSETVQWYIDNARSWFLPDELQAAIGSTGHGASNQREKYVKKQDSVLVFGGNGWVGPQFGQVLKERGMSVSYAKSRLENTADVWREITESQASFVVNAAGITGRPNIDWCESHVDETVRINLEGAVTLARICNRLDVHLTNFATGCIYTYDNFVREPLPEHNPQCNKEHELIAYGTRPFTENDPPNFFGSTYSRVKAIAEGVQKTMGSNVLLLRLRMPLNRDLRHPRNLVNKLLNYHTVITTRNSVSSLDDLLPIAAHMLQDKLAGIYNFTNAGHVSPSDILTLYKQHIDPSHTWRDVTASQLMELKTILAPRSNCYLSNQKMTTYCIKKGIPPPLHALDAVAQCVASYLDSIQR